MAKINEYEDILANAARVLEIVKNDLTDMKNKFGDERRTEISMVTDDFDDEDLIEEEEVILTMTHNGYIKRIPADTYKSQHRGGRGISGMTTREEDFVEKLITTSTHNHILFFTDRGRVYRLKGYQIPEAGRTAKGMAVVNLLPIESDEKVTAIIPIRDFEDGENLLFITKNGVIKKTRLTDYSKIRANGLNAITLDEGDILIRVEVSDGNSQIMLTTYNGMAIRFKETDVRSVGRTARGVRGIKLRSGDYVIGGCTINEGSECLVVTENGYGKKSSFDEYNVQGRAGMGVRTYKITEKTGHIAGMTAVTNDDDLLMITSGGIVIRMHADEISTIGRNTQGVRLMRLDEGVNVVSIALTGKDEDEETTSPDNEELPAEPDDTEIYNDEEGEDENGED